MKRKLRNLAIGGLATAILGYFAWVALSVFDFADWDTWTRSIQIVWVVMPLAFAVSLISAIGWALVPPRSLRSAGWAVALVVLIVAFAGCLAFALAHGGIG